MAGFRGSGSWIPEVAACTLLTRYIRENFKIATFSRLSGKYENFMRIVKAQVHANQNAFNLLWHEKGWGSGTGGTSNY